MFPCLSLLSQISSLTKEVKQPLEQQGVCMGRYQKVKSPFCWFCCLFQNLNLSISFLFFPLSVAQVFHNYHATTTQLESKALWEEKNKLRQTFRKLKNWVWPRGKTVSSTSQDKTQQLREIFFNQLLTVWTFFYRQSKGKRRQWQWSWSSAPFGCNVSTSIWAKLCQPYLWLFTATASKQHGTVAK